MRPSEAALNRLPPDVDLVFAQEQGRTAKAGAVRKLDRCQKLTGNRRDNSHRQWRCGFSSQNMVPEWDREGNLSEDGADQRATLDDLTGERLRPGPFFFFRQALSEIQIAVKYQFT